MSEVEPHYHRHTFGCSDGLSLDSLLPRDRGICGADLPGSQFLLPSTCTLLAGHLGWHQGDDGAKWTPKSSSEEQASG